MSAIITRREDLFAFVGKTVGPSDWLEVTQQRIDAFAEATGDRQWIHCDPERAKRESPYHTTIAHGFLTLSLCALLCGQLVEVTSASAVINYGLNRVRFPRAVPAGSRIRLLLSLTSLTEVSTAILQAQFGCVVELEGEAKPACVAEWLLRYDFTASVD